MSSTANIPMLYVEGNDDKHAIIALLKRHGIDMANGRRPVMIKDHNGVERLLEAMPEATRTATDRPVGFVLDVDVEISDRWAAVCSRLKDAGLVPPTVCPADGYFGQLPGYAHQVGVWMMPDCVSDHGKLEHLLKTLVPAADRLWPHAEQTTDQAKKMGGRFSNNDQIKATTHCWLAWQQEPGKPFGTAISARFLRHDSPEALAFLRWLKRLFSLHDLAV